MKKLIKIFGIFIVLIILSNCTTLSAKSENNTNFYNSFDDEKFTFCGKRPFVKIKINEEIFTFMIDTGTNYNSITNMGLKKMLNLFPEYNSLDFKNSSNSSITLRGAKIGSIKFLVEFYDKSKLYDGILGMPFLIQKSNIVTFNFITKEIFFSKPKMDGTEEKLIPIQLQDYAPFYFFKLKIGDRDEYFIFDTGNEVITLRSNYDNELADMPTADLLFELLNNDKKRKKTNRFKKKKLESFILGNAEYVNQTAVYNDYYLSQAAESARRILSKCSSAGYPLYENRIFQIDFEKNAMIFLE